MQRKVINVTRILFIYLFKNLFQYFNTLCFDPKQPIAPAHQSSINNHEAERVWPVDRLQTYQPTQV